MGQTESTPLTLCCASPRGGGTNDPAFLHKSAAVPPVLERFLEARRVGNVEEAALCCTEDMTMRGPMGEFAGIDVVRAKAFSKPSQPLGKMLMLLQYQPHLSTSTEAVYAREFEAQIGYAQVPLRQEVRAATSISAPTAQPRLFFSFLLTTCVCVRPCVQFTVRYPGSEDARVCLVKFSKLNV